LWLSVYWEAIKLWLSVYWEAIEDARPDEKKATTLLRHAQPVARCLRR